LIKEVRWLLKDQIKNEEKKIKWKIEQVGEVVNQVEFE
jgi:hypothetical protein